MTFLKMLRTRFEGNDTNVPWELDNKIMAYKYVSELGFKTPISAHFKSAYEAISWAQDNLGSRFVVKAGDRHSCIGVYLLEQVGDDTFLELLRIKKLTTKEIGNDIVGVPPSYWIAESFVDSYIYGKSIPFDYKFYTFRGNIALILQIDRNVTPPRMALFDGSFIPLHHGVDYQLDTNRWLSGGHTIPYHAPQMMHMASTISASLDTDFVSIDCFDSPESAIFGEFTFAPGGPDVKMITFSQEILDGLNSYTNGIVPPTLSGINLDQTKLKLDCKNTKNGIIKDISIYSHISSRMSYGDRKTASYINLQDFSLENDALNSHFDFIFKYIGLQQGDNEQAYVLATRLASNSAYFNTHQKHKQFINKAFEYFSSKSQSNPWFETRLEQTKILFFPELSSNSLHRIKEIADNGSAYAKNVFEYLSKSSKAD